MTEITLQELCVFNMRRSLAYQKSVAESLQTLTEDERTWIRQVLKGEGYDPFAISPSYLYQKQNLSKRYERRETVREELDSMRNHANTFTPEALLELRIENERINQGIKNVSGIYIIHNQTKDMFYVGQGIRVFDRAYHHFANKPATNKFDFPEIYQDYHTGDTFSIHVVALQQTAFSDLNELEGHAIFAYDSIVPQGYNRISGNILDKPIFASEDLEKAATLLIDRIKESDLFWSLSNIEKRREYTQWLFFELALPHHTHFYLRFLKFLGAYREANTIKKL